MVEKTPEDAREDAEPSPEEDNGEGRRAGHLRTADVLRRTGITHQILYRYVTLGLIEPVTVTDSGVRYFRPEAVDLIEIIKSFNRTGYSLRDLKDTFFKDERVRRVLARRTPEPPGDG